MFSGRHPSAWGILDFWVSKSLTAFRETDTSKVFQLCSTRALGILEWHWTTMPGPHSAISESFILVCTPWSSTKYEQCCLLSLALQCFTGGKYHLKIFIITLKMYLPATVYGEADNFLGTADSQKPQAFGCESLHTVHAGWNPQKIRTFHYNYTQLFGLITASFISVVITLALSAMYWHPSVFLVLSNCFWSMLMWMN